MYKVNFNNLDYIRSKLHTIKFKKLKSKFNCFRLQTKKTMSNSTATFFFFFVFLLVVSSTVSVADPEKTINEILPSFGFPPGLLPDSVSYTLSDEGSLIVQFASPCQIQLDDDLVSYDKTISATLKLGRINNLEGMKIRKLLIWLNVDSIQVDLPPGGSIYFKIGLINKTVGVEEFKNVHSCVAGVRYGNRSRFIHQYVCVLNIDRYFLIFSFLFILQIPPFQTSSLPKPSVETDANKQINKYNYN